ncbi:nucleotidyltransferase domain-containing protein [Actinopolymorpha pittospori]
MPRQPDEYGDHWTPQELAGLLDGVDVRWCVVGGWALDLAGVRPERAHDDLEIAIPQFELDRLRAWLPDYEFFVMGPNCLWPADAAGGAYFDNPQTFVRDPRTGAWKADVIRSQYDGETWVCQMDRSVRRPYDEAVGVSDANPPDGEPVACSSARSFRRVAVS